MCTCCTSCCRAGCPASPQQIEASGVWVYIGARDQHCRALARPGVHQLFLSHTLYSRLSARCWRAANWCDTASDCTTSFINAIFFLSCRCHLNLRSVYQLWQQMSYVNVLLQRLQQMLSCLYVFHPFSLSVCRPYFLVFPLLRSPRNAVIIKVHI